MRVSLTFLLLVLASGFIYAGRVVAHPPTGIVVDRNGVVYFSGLETIWGVDAQGQLSVFRPGVRGRHVHELSIDEHDNIYGAYISYEPATQRWISSVWKMNPSGEIEYLQEPTHQPPRGLSIWRDRQGNMYAVEQNNHLKKETLVLRRDPDGVVTTLAGSEYGFVRWDGEGSALSKHRWNCVWSR